MTGGIAMALRFQPFAQAPPWMPKGHFPARRAVGGAQGRQLRQPAIRRDGSWFRERIGRHLLLDGLLGCGFELQPEEHARLEGLAGHAGNPGLLGAVGVNEIRGRGHQQWHAGLDDRGLHSGRIALLVGLDAIVAGRKLRQGVGDRLVLDVEELLAVTDTQARRREGEQDDQRDDDEQQRCTADDDLAVDARDGLRPGT